MQLSIIIRNLNEADNLKTTLCAIRQQVCDFTYEIIVVDNESDDDSVAIAQSMGCTVINMPRKQFSYGRALNMGINACTGEYILILSAHVILLNEFFLQHIPVFFSSDDIAALRFVQANYPFQVKQSISEGIKKIRHKTDPGFMETNWNFFMVNHCSAIRKSCWEQLAFNEDLSYSEDKDWAIKMLHSGYSLLYNVPGFYVYAKQIDRDKKISDHIKALDTKQQITGTAEPLYSKSYPLFLLHTLKKEISRLRVQLNIQVKIYKGLKAVNKNRNK